MTALLERFDVLRMRVDGRGLAARIEAFGDVDVGSHIVSGSAMGDSISMVDGPSFVVTAVGDVLNFAAHHLVIDAVSWRLIDAVVRAVTTSTPIPSTSSFAAWSETISALALDRSFLSAQVDFWHKMTAPRCDLETFRHDSLVETLTHIDSFTAVASHALAALNLKPNELLLGIVLWTLSQSTNESHVAVDMEGHGRPQEIDGAESVVGWLTSVFPVASRRFGTNEMEAALIHAKTVLRKVPHGGIGFGIVRHLTTISEREKLESLTAQCLVNFLGEIVSSTPSMDIVRTAPEFTRTHALSVDAWIDGGALALRVLAPSNSTFAVDLGNAFSSLASLRLDRRFTLADCKLDGSGVEESHIDACSVAAHPFQIESIVPATDMQAGLLFHKDDYFSTHVLTVAAHVDVATLKNAWRAVIAHHDALRTGFFLSGPIPLQAVLVADEILVTTVLGGEQMTGDGVYPLHTVSIEPGIVTWAHHHAILDGWSIAIVLEDVQKAARGVTLDRVSVTFASVAQHAYDDRAANLACAKVYWTKTLSDDARDVTDLLTGSGHTFRYLEHKIPAHTILDTARGHGVTLSSTVMLAWIRTLQLMTGVYEEILVGVTVSGRDGRLEGIDTVVGLLIETIPFVGPLLHDKSDRRQLHDMALQLSDSQEHLCASLNDIQHWTDRKSLFQSVCVHENYPGTDTDALFASVLVHERTHFPLAMLSVIDAEGNLRLQLQGNMEAASLEHLSSALCSQLANLANPDTHFKDTDQTLLVSDQRLTWTMGDFLAASASMARDSVALVDGDVQLSYDLVEGEVERIAIGLETKFNVQPQDVVGVMLPRGAPMMLTIWAIMHLGAVYMPLQLIFPRSASTLA